MKLLVFLFSLMALVGGCSWIPRAGPSTSDVLEQGQAGGEILFDVVPVDDRVVNTLIAQPKERLALRFKKDVQPPEVKIAIGDTVSVLIWESAAGGLFSETPPAPATGLPSGVEPLAPESRPPPSGQQDEFGIPRPPTETGRPQERSNGRVPASRFRPRQSARRPGGGRLRSRTRRSEPMARSAYPMQGVSRQPADCRRRCSR